jgi:hypothetical protein
MNLNLYKKNGAKVFLNDFRESIYKEIKSNSYESIEEFLNLISFDELLKNSDLIINTDYISTIVDDENSKLHSLIIISTLFNNRFISSELFEKYIIYLLDNFDNNTIFNTTVNSNKIVNSISTQLSNTDYDNEDINGSIFDILSTTFDSFNLDNESLYNRLVDRYSSYILNSVNRDNFSNKEDYIDALHKPFIELDNQFYGSDIIIVNLRKLIDDESVIEFLSSDSLYNNLFNSYDIDLNIYYDRSNAEQGLHLELLRNSDTFITRKTYSNMTYTYFNSIIDKDDRYEPIKLSNYKNSNLYEVLLLAQYQLLDYSTIIEDTEDRNISFSFSNIVIDKDLISTYLKSKDIKPFTNPNLLLLDLRLVDIGLTEVPDIKDISILYNRISNDYKEIDSATEYKCLNELKSRIDSNIGTVIRLKDLSSKGVDSFKHILFYTKLLVDNSIKRIYQKTINLDKDIEND